MSIDKVMSMKDTITITSKGQTTLPALVRKKMGLGKDGGVLQISFDERKGELTVKKAMTIEEISERVSRHIKPGTVPLTDVDAYYQAYRRDPRI